MRSRAAQSATIMGCASQPTARANSVVPARNTIESYVSYPIQSVQSNLIHHTIHVVRCDIDAYCTYTKRRTTANTELMERAWVQYTEQLYATALRESRSARHATATTDSSQMSNCPASGYAWKLLHVISPQTWHFVYFGCTPVLHRKTRDIPNTVRQSERFCPRQIAGFPVRDL